MSTCGIAKYQQKGNKEIISPQGRREPQSGHPLVLKWKRTALLRQLSSSIILPLLASCPNRSKSTVDAYPKTACTVHTTEY